MGDCGYRPTKRPVRVGANIESSTCGVPSYKFNPTSTAGVGGHVENTIEALCSDFSDDFLHTQDLRLRTGSNGADEQCGRGTQAPVCRTVAETTMGYRFDPENTDSSFGGGVWRLDEYANSDEGVYTYEEQRVGSLAYNNYRYREKATYINPNLAGQGACKSPTNLLANAAGQLVRPILYHDAANADGQSLVGDFTIWFSQGYTLAENLELWTKLSPEQGGVCSDGGEGSIRVPFEFGGATADTLFFYDFACPYGSQPEACADYPREGLQEYQETFDELLQPSGPAFANCFDKDVPDFECCHAETAFRIHGGPGKIGNFGIDDLEYCAVAKPVHVHGLPNVYAYNATEENKGPDLQGLTRIVDPDNPGSDGKNELVLHGYSLEGCMAYCDSLVGYPTFNPTTGTIGTGDCHSLRRYEGEILLPARCTFYTETASEVTAGTGYWTLHVQNTLAYQMSGYGTPCPLYMTSFHHTTTGCKAFCRAAFQRDGDDNTCMPGKPECANWLDSNDFPTEQYVTVNAECICGAKLEEYQDSGKYVHRGFDNQGTVLHEARALHEDDGADDDDWEWPDEVSAGIDQFFGAHFDVGDTCIAEIMSFRTDLLNNSECDGYLDMGANDIPAEWDPSNPGDHAACAEDNDKACCVVHRGTEQASRLWKQTGYASVRSVASSFESSSIVGTAVHTSRVAAVGNFVRRNPQPLVTNRPTVLYSQYFVLAEQRRHARHHHWKSAVHAKEGVEGAHRLGL